MDWVTSRIKEWSSHQGVIVAVAAAMVLFGGMSLTQVVLWGALIWGIWSVLKTD